MAKAKAGADTESLELLHTAGEKVKCENEYRAFKPQSTREIQRTSGATPA